MSSKPLTKNDILTELYKSKFIDDLIWTITGGNQLKDDLKSELFLILVKLPDSRIINAYTNNWLNYMCVNIVKKQYHSNTSPFHRKYRRNSHDEPLPEITSEYTNNDDKLIKEIMWFVNNKLDLVDRELFKIYYKIDRYDRWFGDLKDNTCEKPTSSLHKVARKLAITSVEGKKITIGYDTIRLSLNRSIMRIKHYLKQNGLYDDYFNN